MREKSWLYFNRIRKIISQKELGKMTGISRTCICLFEVGSRLPHPRDAKKIADALGFEWTRFYEDPINPELME